MDKVKAETVELTSAVETARQELEQCQASAAEEEQEFKQLKTWADLCDNCSFAAKKMIVSQFIKAVYVYRDYTIEAEFNVSFDEFQALAAETRSLGNEKAGVLAISAKKDRLA